MPFGRGADEQRWFRGWYEAVIEVAVAQAGLEPILAATENQPGAINDEIRSHLVFDPMVVVDLGGKSPSDPPNPNVMYELGIRHAFGLPVVIMAWEDQQLPFDVNNQRAVLSRRDFLDIEPTTQKLVQFIEAASAGRFYNPMEAVGREAFISRTSRTLGKDSLLGALAEEVRDLRQSISHQRVRPSKGPTPEPSPRAVKSLISKGMRADLWLYAENLGFDAKMWTKFLWDELPEELAETASNWDFDEWKSYFDQQKGFIESFILEEKAPKLPLQPDAADDRYKDEASQAGAIETASPPGAEPPEASETLAAGLTPRPLATI
jgi:hypothetical protein